MSAPSAHAAIDQILGHLRGEPSRTWSIIITVFGDAIVPRGGTVWLGTLLSFFTALGIGENVVRTAVSRLAADGWLERSKVGRNSFYRLAPKGAEAAREATTHIYAQRPPHWQGRFALIFTNGEADRETLRREMAAAGFGLAAPDVWIAPEGTPLPAIAGDAVQLAASGDAGMLKRLAGRSWALEELAEAYTRFVESFAPLGDAVARGERLSNEQAMVARVLLIHEYRRIVLRDPILPGEILPEGWPGDAARALCAAVYPQLLGPSEAWLDANGTGEDGAKLPEALGVWERFRD